MAASLADAGGSRHRVDEIQRHADGLSRLLALDDESRSAMRAAARQTAERFSWPVVAEQTAEFLLDDR